MTNLKLITLLALVSFVDGRSSGAAACPGGIAAATGHGAPSGSLADGSFELMLDGEPVTGSSLSLGTGIYGLSVSSTDGAPIRGILFRMESTGSFVLSPGNMLQDASVCNSPVQGVTHMNANDKSVVEAEVDFFDAGEAFLDITVVESRLNPQLQYHTRFTISVADETDPPAPPPTNLPPEPAPPTMTPTAPPTDPPPEPVPPTMAPTASPIDPPLEPAPPTVAPTMSPTASPTYLPFVQECWDANVVSNSITEGSLDDAILHDSSYYACQYNVSRGVWYEHSGDGSLLTIEACSTDFEVEVAVFAGNCSNSVCLGLGKRTNECVFYAWPTNQGEDYIVLVHSINETAVGNYYVDFDSLDFVS